MFEDLQKNIQQEKKIIIDLRSLHAAMKREPTKKRFYMSSAIALLQQLRILNQAVPELLKEWSPTKKYSTLTTTKTPTNNTVQRKTKIINPTPKNTVRMAYKSPITQEKQYVTINKNDKRNFLEKLKISEENLKNIRKGNKTKKIDEQRKPSQYARISNKYFRSSSEKIAPNFASLEQDLKKANVRFLLTTYLSIATFSIMLTLLASTLIYGILLAFNLSYWTYAWIIILFPSLTAIFFYLYPASEASSTQKKVTRELPFATIHMAAIAGSEITPIKIFKIISESKEYPAIGAEMKKIIIQIEVYGYDLVTSLKNVASRTSNRRFSELLSGIATNVSTGGSLKNYLQKKAENFLLDYRLERQKYSNLAGTFMDVYISILIAAPLVLMMMFIVMNVAGLGLAGLGIVPLLFLSIAAIVIINILFLIILNLKQPEV